MDVNQTVNFVNDIEFNDIKTEPETKEGIAKIKTEKIESPEVKQEGKRSKTDFKQTVDFVKDIEFNDIKTETETKRAIVKMKEEKIESPEFKQSLDFVKKIEFEGDFKPKLEIKKEKIESPEVKEEGKQAKTDFKQTVDFVKKIEFEGDVKPKLEVKKEKTDSPKVKIEIKKEFKVKDEPLHVKEEFDDELQKGLVVLDTMDDFQGETLVSLENDSLPQQNLTTTSEFENSEFDVMNQHDEYVFEEKTEGQ